MWPGCEVDHSLPSGSEGENEWSCNSPPHLCLYGVERDNLLLIFLKLSILITHFYYYAFLCETYSMYGKSA